MKMKTRNILIMVSAVSLWFVPSVTEAQVDKKVVVTKTYKPVVSGALKLPITPDMADTVKMRPEIDYGITPLMYSPELAAAHSFKPAKVTYWDFNRPTNFYLKLGVGYPINTVGDFYMSTYNVRTGYLMAAANHYGEFGKQRNWFGDSRNILKSSTRARVAGGLYAGKRMFEGELVYDSEVGRRYGAPLSFYSTDNAAPSDPSLTAEYEDFKLKFRFGDDFQDLSRTNFNIDLYGDFFHDKSDWIGERYNLQQFDYGIDGRIGRRLKERHYVEADLRYNGQKGIKNLHYSDNTVWAGLRYGYNTSLFDMLVGVDYCYDNSDRAHHYVLPYLKMQFNIFANGALTPFVEVDGTLHNNDYFSLARHTVYVGYTDEMAALPNTLEYALRAGFAGKVRGRFGYSLYVGLSHADNALYWYNYDYEWMMAKAARREMLSLNLELDYRPVDAIILSAGVHGRFFKEYAKLNGIEMGSGESPIEGDLKFRYRHKKFSVGASAAFGGATEWTSVEPAEYMMLNADSELHTVHNVRMPGYVDLGVDFEWNLKEDWKIFVEGSNLANMKIYKLAYFRQQGIRCTAGFKFTF